MEKEIKDWKNSLSDQAQFKYYLDYQIHKRIDKILQLLVKIECNNGIDSTPEELQRADKRKELLYYAIKQLDEKFYERIIA